ncbi:hypothetical protein [Silvanigrella aquatica]|uniref:Uncharacterized protein n=1 Tax=Silvanigrella aquatica TaxID=1915309 RepID=A0A1L4CZU3_9BACT|nr:hypothetical protein [Silvanigrella aquatica]APJ03472.1 hypothetical protein AXG55_05955 [Silvanigrella aquatica]
MKKFLLFLIILFLPTILALVAMYYFMPKDFKSLTDLGKEKLVSTYPALNRYLDVNKKVVAKKAQPVPTPVKPKKIDNTLHFTNAEVYLPICGKEIKEKFFDNFTGCNFCPKYLSNDSSDNKFEYFSDSRGKVFKKEDEEAVVFMKGCTDNENNGVSLVLRKGYGGWQRKAAFQGVYFDKKPLEYKDSNGFFIFIAKRTSINNINTKQELVQMRLRETNAEQRILFSADMTTQEKCDKDLQSSFGNPLRENDKTFSASLEIIGCEPTALSGSHNLVFKLENDEFIPNKETASLMTKIEKYGESL